MRSEILQRQDIDRSSACSCALFPNCCVLAPVAGMAVAGIMCCCMYICVMCSCMYVLVALKPGASIAWPAGLLSFQPICTHITDHWGVVVEFERSEESQGKGGGRERTLRNQAVGRRRSSGALPQSRVRGPRDKSPATPHPDFCG